MVIVWRSSGGGAASRPSPDRAGGSSVYPMPPMSTDRISHARRSFAARLEQRPLLFDGAMGTLLYSRGVPQRASLDELVVSRPDLIGAVHREYIAAGADVIETNTFGANRFRLAPYGLSDRAGRLAGPAGRWSRADPGRRPGLRIDRPAGRGGAAATGARRPRRHRAERRVRLGDGEHVQRAAAGCGGGVGRQCAPPVTSTRPGRYPAVITLGKTKESTG